MQRQHKWQQQSPAAAAAAGVAAAALLITAVIKQQPLRDGVRVACCRCGSAVADVAQCC
jgi:hypothetical protein